jgi:hypothetical protein
MALTANRGLHMLSEEHPLGTWIPTTESERTAVEEQLERILKSHYFSNSRRFPPFLRYVVNQALNGHSEGLKERTVGVEVFEKKADYDTTADPIVRVTAVEIRKRIAQYYQEPGHESEIRLLLPPGAYVPQFILPRSEVTTSSLAENGVLATDANGHLKAPHRSFRSRLTRKKLIMAGSVLAVFAVAGAFLGWRMSRLSGFEQFWQPVVQSKYPVLLCVADQNEYATIELRDAADPLHSLVLKDNLVAIVFDDVSPLTDIAGFLQSHQRTYTIKSESTTTFSDLRQGPNIFIGGFDNVWTLRLTKGLRFHFANDAQMKRLWIADSKSPDKQTWVIDREQQQTTNTYKDYALVARFIDSDADHVAVIAAGIGRGGTIAAGEFLTNPQYLDDLARDAPRGWRYKNAEAVIETQVIDGRSGPPHVVASYFW